MDTQFRPYNNLVERLIRLVAIGEEMHRPCCINLIAIAVVCLGKIIAKKHH